MNEDLAILKAHIEVSNEGIKQFLDMLKLSKEFLHDLLGAVQPMSPISQPRSKPSRPKSVNWMVEGF